MDSGCQAPPKTRGFAVLTMVQMPNKETMPVPRYSHNPKVWLKETSGG